MNDKELLLTLHKNYHFKKNHLSILTLLLNSTQTAPEIVGKTHISLGRIYSLLNELIEMNLVEKKEGNPAKYSAQGLRSRAHSFLRFHVEEEMKKQRDVLGVLEKEKDVSQVTAINSSEDYDLHTISFLMTGDWFKIIHRQLSLAWIIFPEEEGEFWKLRQQISKRRKTLSTDKREGSILKLRALYQIYRTKPVQEMMTQEAMDSYVKMLREELGEKYIREWATGMLEKLKQLDNVHFYIIPNHYSVFTSYISNVGVLSVLGSGEDTTGVKLIGKRVSDTHSKAYDDLVKRAVRAEDYLKKLAK